MPRELTPVEEALSRATALFERYDARTPAASAARRRYLGRTARSVGKRVATIGMALAALIVATIAFALIVGPIGIGGLFVVALATMCILVAFSAWPMAKEAPAYSEAMPTPQVVQRLDRQLHRKRAALPAPAARKLDAISAQLPLLESRLAEVDLLDPLAQDARRLMGKHLPDLIDRYERVPAQYRAERDGEGLTVDDRLLAGLDAAGTALGDIGARLVQNDRDAFDTHGRFIESRYKDGAGIKGE